MKEQEIIKQLKAKRLSYSALVEKVECKSKRDEEVLKEELSRLQDEGIIYKSGDFYSLLESEDMFLAEVTFKNRNFVILQDVQSKDEYRISGQESSDFLIGDLLYIREFQKETYHAVEYYRANSRLKGYYSLSSTGERCLLVSYLNNCDKKIKIADDNSLDIKDGDFLSCHIVDIEGDVIVVDVDDILVKASDVGSDISTIIALDGAKLRFDEKTLEESRSLPTEVTSFDRGDRTDFTSDCVVTIDGDDAKDYDDAVSIKRLNKGYELKVHIADVTEYVKVNHPLDDEAVIRGTSIYVADRVVPMLPFELSNGICSLNPNVERLTLSVTMEIDAMGNVFRSKIERGIIKSKARLTYREVNAYFEGKEVSFSDEIKDMLTVLHECSSIIRKRRERQGTISLDTTEIKFKLDEEGNPLEVIKQVQGESEKMIEDLMIVTNCTVARALASKGIPVLYRVHELPPKDKLSVFKDYLRKLGLLSSFPRDEFITSSRLNDFLKSIKDENLKKPVNYMMLRSMAKARYTPEDLGHFGLAEDDYCHFTSPIRRYPDDIIHRLVKDYILDNKTFDYDDLYDYLSIIGDRMTDLEILATKIEREVEDLESAKYMSTKIGETFHGIVTGLNSKGLFITTDIGIEGFLPYHSMDGDYFYYSEKDFTAFGKETGKPYKMADEIDVAVLSCSIDDREVDFATPQFYLDNAVDMTEEEREYLSLNGIRLYLDNDVREARYRKDSYFNRERSKNMNENERRENISSALDDMKEREDKIHERRDDEFTPSPEQWKEVDVIRAVKAKYPDDEEKVIQVLAVMDISKEEYDKLLRFTKPREDRHSSRGDGRRGSFSRGGDRRGSSRGHFDRRPSGDHSSDRHSSRDGDHSHYSRDGQRRSFSRGDDRGHSSRSGDRRSSFSRGDRRSSSRSDDRRGHDR